MTEINTHSRDWQAIKAWAEARLDEHRTELEQHGLGVEHSEFVRGRISELRALLDLPTADARPLAPGDPGDV